MKFKKPKKQSNSTIVVGYEKGSKQRKPYLLVFILFGILLVGGSAVILLKNSNQFQARSRVCESNQDLIGSMSDALVQQNIEEQQSIAGIVLNFEDFKNDPNCTFYLASYYKNLSDPESARIYFDDFKDKHKQDSDLSEELRATLPTIETLEEDIKFLESGVNDAEAASPYGEDYKYKEPPK